MKAAGGRIFQVYRHGLRAIVGEHWRPVDPDVVAVGHVDKNQFRVSRQQAETAIRPLRIAVPVQAPGETEHIADGQGSAETALDLRVGPGISRICIESEGTGRHSGNAGGGWIADEYPGIGIRRFFKMVEVPRPEAGAAVAARAPGVDIGRIGGGVVGVGRRAGRGDVAAANGDFVGADTEGNVGKRPDRGGRQHAGGAGQGIGPGQFSSQAFGGAAQVVGGYRVAYRNVRWRIDDVQSRQKGFAAGDGKMPVGSAVVVPDAQFLIRVAVIENQVNLGGARHHVIDIGPHSATGGHGGIGLDDVMPAVAADMDIDRAGGSQGSPRGIIRDRDGVATDWAGRIDRYHRRAPAAVGHGNRPVLFIVVVPDVGAVVEADVDLRRARIHRVGVFPIGSILRHGGIGADDVLPSVAADVDLDGGGALQRALVGIVADGYRVAAVGRSGIESRRCRGGIAIENGDHPIGSAVVLPVGNAAGHAVESDFQLRGGGGKLGGGQGEGEGAIARAGHVGAHPDVRTAGEAIVAIDRGGASHHRCGCIEGDGDGRTVGRGGRRERGVRGRAALAVVHHEYVLDIGLKEVAFGVLSLNVVVKQLAAESGNSRVGDLGEIVVGDLGGFDEVVDVAGVGQGVQRGTVLGQHPLGHRDGNPAFDIAAARIGFIVVVGHRVDAIFIAADFENHAAGRDAGQVVGVGPDIELRPHLLVEIAVDRRDIEPAECIGAGIVGKPLRAEESGGRPVVVPPGRRQPRGEHLDGPPVGERLLDFVIVALAAIVVETGIQAA